ncbi:MAG: hypothetical protein HY376_03355 [Candidatus Blackburnbacteria bacterium]|nr:hypothetical protein [Candidatus Blackburnbacteria bacterium]
MSLKWFGLLALSIGSAVSGFGIIQPKGSQLYGSLLALGMATAFLGFTMLWAHTSILNPKYTLLNRWAHLGLLVGGSTLATVGLCAIAILVGDYYAAGYLHPPMDVIIAITAGGAPILGFVMLIGLCLWLENTPVECLPPKG